MFALLSRRTAAVVMAATVTATLAAAPARATVREICVQAATFRTEIQWGGSKAPWNDDDDLTVYLGNRNTIIEDGYAPADTTLSWESPTGRADITFRSRDIFTGTAQFPGEGPVGYRGTLVDEPSTTVCEPAVAAFRTSIQWGGDTAPWHPDTDLVALIENRHTVIDSSTAAGSTRLSWTSPNGNGDITFGVKNIFSGTAQFPGEGPVGYRGSR